MSPEAWREFSAGSFIKRANRRGFVRNVAVALGNSGDPAAVAPLTVVRWTTRSRWCAPMQHEALGKLGEAASMAALQSRLSTKSEASALEAFRAALVRLTWSA